MPKLIESINPEVASLLHANPFQDQSSDIVVNASLPRMAKDPAKEPPRATVGRTGHVLAAMPPKFEPATAAAAGPTDRVMQPFIIGPERAVEARTAGPMIPQKEMERHAIPGSRTDGYVRMRVRVTDDKMRILSVQNVDGPLAQPDSIVGQHAYEVTLDSHRLSAEGIADVGVQRSYPRPGQHEHHIAQLPSFEFTVRVPRAALPEGALERLRINLYRFPDASRKAIIGSALLSQQLGPQASLIARIEGLRAQHVDPIAIEQFTKVFPSLKIQ